MRNLAEWGGVDVAAGCYGHVDEKRDYQKTLNGQTVIAPGGIQSSSQGVQAESAPEMLILTGQ